MGMRHQVITTAVEAAAQHGWSLLDVLRFSRHSPSSVRLLVTYRDRAEDRRGALAELVARGQRTLESPAPGQECEGVQAK